MIRYDRVPLHIRDAVRVYVERGEAQGVFRMALFQNDLVAAAGNADKANLRSLREWALWHRNDAPKGCLGSGEAVEQWSRAGGMERPSKKENAD